MRVVFVLFFLGSVCQYSCAADNYLCFSGAPVGLKTVRNVQIKISSYHPGLDPNVSDCRITIRDGSRKTILSAEDHAFSIALVGLDVNGDGVPDMVLEGDSGGMHGTSAYYILSLGKEPRLILQFQTEGVPARFVRNTTSGGMEIHTWDGAFVSFDNMATAFSPYPDIYFQVLGGTLKDVSQHHRAEYDRAIRKVKRGLRANDFARFRVIDESWEKAGEEEPASAVARIALLYLYSGRESRAHQTIQQMWPAWDQDRIWKLILETRQRGLSQFATHKVS